MVSSTRRLSNTQRFMLGTALKPLYKWVLADSSSFRRDPVKTHGWRLAWWLWKESRRIEREKRNRPNYVALNFTSIGRDAILVGTPRKPNEITITVKIPATPENERIVAGGNYTITWNSKIRGGLPTLKRCVELTVTEKEKP